MPFPEEVLVWLLTVPINRLFSITLKLKFTSLMLELNPKKKLNLELSMNVELKHQSIKDKSFVRKDIRIAKMQLINALIYIIIAMNVVKSQLERLKLLSTTVAREPV